MQKKILQATMVIKLWECNNDHSDHVDEVGNKLEDIYSRVEEIELDGITEDFVTETKKELADLEDRSRRNNLHFDGYQDETNET